MTKRNPFEQSGEDTPLSGGDVMEGMYGSVPSGGGRQVAKATSIYEIWPDLRQPRRVIPAAVRGHWVGDPAELADVLRKWQAFAEEGAGKKLDVAKAIKGQAALSVEDGEALYGDFGKLVALAAAIYSEGLTNPVTVIRSGAAWKIETGERRWLAHHLLALNIDAAKYGKVAAREVDYDPFRQASENNVRDSLNAIGMARQIALLIMEARKDLDGVKYDAFEDMVLAGECDRKYYAQVANGHIHKIPDGLADKICNATGLSIARLSQYRRLLRLSEDESLNDEIWVEADTKGWTENYIRENVLPSLNPPKERLTAVNHSPTPTSAFPTNESPFKDGDKVITETGQRGHIIQTKENTHLVKMENGATLRFGWRTLRLAEAAPTSWFGKYVQNVSGGVGAVIADFDSACEVEYADGTRGRIGKEYLSFVDKAEYEAMSQHYRELANKQIVGKYVRTFQGVAKVIRNHDLRYVEVQFPDGDKAQYLKTDLEIVDEAAWNEAVEEDADRQAINAGRQWDKGAATPDKQASGTETPSLKFKVGDRVTVQTGINNATGEIRYIKPESKQPYGIFLYHSQSTHYYAEWMVTPYGEGLGQGSDNVNSTKPDEPEMELVGKWVRLKNGLEGRVEGGRGDKLIFRKAGADVTQEVYRAAVMSVMNEAAAKASHPVSGNGKLVTEKIPYTMLRQMREIALQFVNADAVETLELLMNVTEADIRQFSKNNDKDTVTALLQKHYGIIGEMLGIWHGQIAEILNAWQAVDDEERGG